MLTVASLALFVAAAPITVITASSTNDAPAACLLDGKCTWKPSSADGGVDEGIGLRFRESLACEHVEVVLKTAAPSPRAPLDASFGAYNQDLTSKDGGKTWRGNCHPSRSLFLRVLPSAEKSNAVEIASIRFLTKEKPVDVVLPKSVNATVTASSVLAPTTAYQPAFLFDSKTDLAWATDGKKGDGKGATLTITFDEPQEIAGVMVWNGYQRSEPHYTSNSRPSMISVKAGGKAAQVTLDTTELSWDELRFAPLPASKTVEVVVDAVQKGAKYKDLVVSELRFLDKGGRLIAPSVAIEKTAPPADLTALLDKSYAGAVAAVTAQPKSYCVDRRVRVRSGGSFVIYTGDDTAPDGTGVVEGGWNAGKTPTSLRVFGKRYRSIVTQGEYGGIEEVVPEIFQSDLTLAPFASLSGAEQDKIIDVIYDVTSSDARTFKGEQKAYARDGSVLASGATYAELKKALAKALAAQGAIAARSSVYTDALVPTDAAGACKR